MFSSAAEQQEAAEIFQSQCAYKTLKMIQQLKSTLKSGENRDREQKWRVCVRSDLLQMCVYASGFNKTLSESVNWLKHTTARVWMFECLKRLRYAESLLISSAWFNSYNKPPYCSSNSNTEVVGSNAWTKMYSVWNKTHS